MLDEELKKDCETTLGGSRVLYTGILKLQRPSVSYKVFCSLCYWPQPDGKRASLNSIAPLEVYSTQTGGSNSIVKFLFSGKPQKTQQNDAAC